MFGIIYIIISMISGFAIMNRFLPFLSRIGVCDRKNSDPLPVRMITLPAAWLVGTLLMTWLTYIISYLASVLVHDKNPMFWGNLVTLVVFGLPASYIIWTSFRTHKSKDTIIRMDQRFQNMFSEYKPEIIFTAAIIFFSSFLMFYTFFISGNSMFVGLSVWGDFGPHLAMIRSFSLGDNFPTQYPHFVDGNIKYHFMFQFLAANLEYLGLRIDWAFNIPSILSMVAFFLLLYSLSVMITGKRWIGILAGILFIFRSSYAVFTYIYDFWGKSSFFGIIDKILHNQTYIGKTLHEDWGLWTQNVYVNQRHLCFSMAVLLMILIGVYPLFEKMAQSLREAKGKRLKEFILSSDAWLPENLLRAIVLGLLLGAISFWNGAVVFASLSILLFFAILSKHRLEYLLIAIITVVLALLQSAFFIGPGKNAVSPQLFIGFLAADKSLSGILKYYNELFGVFSYILIIALFILPKGKRWPVLAFSAPLVMATTIQLTPDINANHKFIIISVLLLNIFVAWFLYRLFSSHSSFMMVTAIILSVLLTATGIVDFITLINLNTKQKDMVYQVNDPEKLWVVENTRPDAVFLTDMYVLDPILLAGRKLYLGWPYYAWSAGYDTYGRNEIVKQIYGATDAANLKRLIQDGKIDYIVIEDANRLSKEYVLNENLIAATYTLVYEDTARKLKIFRTH